MEGDKVALFELFGKTFAFPFLFSVHCKYQDGALTTVSKLNVECCARHVLSGCRLGDVAEVGDTCLPCFE